MASSKSSTLNDTSYGADVQRQRNFIINNKLQSTGISLDLNLPQICVLGSQSSGKSSLIESISKIPLPRASGTCTRCPTECNLEHSGGPWKCEIALRFKFDEYGNPLSDGQKEFPFGPIILKKTDVVDRLRRAQLAILSPNLDSPTFPQSFLTAPSTSSSRTSFSLNTIVMKISGPDVVDLSFVDLPGIIATSISGTDKNDPQRVRDLAHHYVENPVAIILLTVTCETDFDNQGAWDIVQKYDPEGARTIGVATKPDRIETGQEDACIRLLQNTVMRVENGWFCVKLPGPEQLKRQITFEEARKLDVEYFKKAPWANHSELAPCYTVGRLTERLGAILSSAITARLPSLLAEIIKQLNDTQTMLRALPALNDDDPVGEVMRLVSEFHRQVEVEIAGTTRKDGLIQKMRVHEQDFREHLRGTAPRFKPSSRGEYYEGESSEPPSIPFLDTQEQDLGTAGTHPVMYLDEVETRARESISRELVGYTPFAVEREMIERFIDLWDEPAQQLFRAVERTANDHFSALSKKHFANYTSLHAAINNIIFREQTLRQEETLRRIEWILSVELHATFTLNAHYLESYRAKFVDFYRSLRSDAGSYDGGENAIRIMADVRAYWQVAFKRFADYTALAVDMDYVRAFGRGLDRILIRDLGLTRENARTLCVNYLQEPKGIVNQRRELKAKVERLEEARSAIETWMTAAN